MKGVYAIFRNSDNVCIYVGQSKQIESRIKRHFNRKPDNDEDWHNIIHKKEKDYHYIVLKECDENTRGYWEKYYIAELKPLYNKTSGGDFVMDNYPISAIEKLKQYKGDNFRGDTSGEKNGMYHKKWMNNGIQNKVVPENEIDYYLSKGYVIGQLKFKKRGPHTQDTIDKIIATKKRNGTYRAKMPQSAKEKISIARKNYYKTNEHPNQGRIQMIKDNHLKYVKKEQIDYYISNGWQIRKNKSLSR